MFERPQGGENAILVCLTLGRQSVSGSDELRELAVSAGATVVALVTGRRDAPDPKYFVGKGKANEIAEIVVERCADLVIFDHELTPAQERNLERLFQCRVLDRTGLILDIFAQRARSFEGKLQVELAQLKHLSTRLVRGWTHLERQKGGIGLRGPGETQLEVDRRLLAARIKQITKRLDKVRQQREQSRRARQKAVLPTVSVVGYTNAGKSTFFNQLTGADIYVADQLFATLDSTLRRVEIGDSGPIVLADTVGFVRQLPHDLIAAFRSTLEETIQSHLLLHVIDVTHVDYEQQRTQVNQVLKEIGAEDIPQIEIYNKIDLSDNHQPRQQRNEAGMVNRIWLSSQNNQGLDLVVEAFKAFFGQELVRVWVKITPAGGAVRAKLYALNAVLQENLSANGDFLLQICLQKKTLNAMNDENFEVLENFSLQNGQLLVGTG